MSREGRLRAIFDNAPVGIDDTAPSGEFVRANPRFCQITGYTADELRSLRLRDIIHPDDLAAYLANRATPPLRRDRQLIRWSNATCEKTAASSGPR